MRYLILFLLFHAGTTIQAQQRLRLAVAGTSHGHAAFIFGRPDKGDIEIVGIYEPDPAVAKLRAKQFHLADTLFYQDLNKMLLKVKPTAVVAFGDIKSHRDIVAAAAPKGIHIMVEKPLATTVADAVFMDSLARKHKVHLLTDYETSWYPSVAKVFQLVNDSNYVGKVRKVMVNDGHQGPKEIGCGPEFLAWLTDPVLNGGGALMDFGCYGANLMTALAKNRMPVSVTAVARHFKPHVYPKVEDDATILVDYGDMQCTIQASWNWTFNRKDMEVYGDKGLLLAPSAEVLVQRNQSKNGATGQQVTDKDVHVYTDPFQYFIAVINGQEQLPEYGLYAPANNVIVVKILDAARRSVATGKTIKL
ncbi:putative dehydrogenase [Chitinophaga terrae (ex Kim and Jung 2007)]|uniref:Gfo/Idh/MocA family protein n=1 Tax=Chitinophaga terrae (ex Kim and Jung 2007) TaxID=408074 RepID=UPI00278B513B|nr:Gfo/Idh/MocA family oxidoreductase [Chitinophaga terrae (ex Kim and Jung 2007)]MDQ0106702.1 putative dehydrogenase [Chitinophaga terrae (ex Kim and Jung 2007)]